MVERMRPNAPPDLFLVASIAVLVAFGLIMLFSASSYYAVALHHDALYFLKRQIAWLVIGGVIAFVVYKVDYHKLRKLAPFALGLSVFMLLLVLIPHVGIVSGGARRWLGAGPMTFEPSEFAKLALILYLAAALAGKGERVRSLTGGVMPVALVCAVLTVLVLKEPDMGTASLLAFTAGAMLFAAGARIVHLLVIVAVAAPGIILLIANDAYKRARILAFIDPWKDPQDKGFHIVQSLLALGSGGPFGAGLGLSSQKFSWLPEAHTDFIAAIIGEELGFMGMFVLVALFVAFAYRAARIALGAPDRFGFFLALGCMATIVIQAFVNIGVVTSAWPVTGVPLPFISFGGSSLVVSLAAVALIINVGRHRRRPAPE
jgi:cell division protein FtsW